MNSSRRRFGWHPRLLDSGNSSINRLVRVRRIFLFGQRETRRPVMGVSRAPSLGPRHRGVEEEREAVVRAVVRRDMSKVKCFVRKKFGHYVRQCLNRKNKKGGTTATTEEIDFQT
jgi:hypothetical protein